MDVINRDSVRSRIAEGGRIVILAEFRKALGLCTGDPVILTLEDGELHVFSPDQGIRRAQAVVRQDASAEPPPADELIAERRAEAARE